MYSCHLSLFFPLYSGNDMRCMDICCIAYYESLSICTSTFRIEINSSIYCTIKTNNCHDCNDFEFTVLLLFHSARCVIVCVLKLYPNSGTTGLLNHHHGVWDWTGVWTALHPVWLLGACPSTYMSVMTTAVIATSTASGTQSEASIKPLPWR